MSVRGHATACSRALESGDIDAHPPGPPGERVPGHEGRLARRCTETFPTDEQYGFAVEKGNTAVLDFINAGLATLREDGRFDEIYAHLLR